LEAENEADPEAAARKEEALEIAARRREEAERLDDEERNEIKARMKTVFDTGDQ
jgi:hypothetical protein